MPRMTRGLIQCVLQLAGGCAGALAAARLLFPVQAFNAPLPEYWLRVTGLGSLIGGVPGLLGWIAEGASEPSTFWRRSSSRFLWSVAGGAFLIGSVTILK